LVLWLGAASCRPASENAKPVQPPAAPVLPAAAPKPVGKPQKGVASYFGREIAGRTTASGAPAKPRAMTAASRTLPLGSSARVTNTETGKAVNVTVTDRGPYAKHRVIDVSSKAASKLGMKKKGVARVKVQQVQTPQKPPSG
jgi:rare lipoprotein A